MMSDVVQGGSKRDGGKPRMDLIDPRFQRALAEVLTFGAEKYDAWNWSKGIAYSRVYAALQRHLTAWWAGEPLDEESGKSHLAHAACCLMFLTAFEERGMEEWDDRPDFLTGREVEDATDRAYEEARGWDKIDPSKEVVR